MAKLRVGLVLALDVFLVSAYLVLAHINGAGIGERVNNLAFSLFPLVGAVLLARHPRNPVSSLVTVLGLSVLGAGTMFEYASLDLHEQTAGFPLTGEAAWASMILWSFTLPSLVLIVLHFPDGRLPGRGWKALVIVTILNTMSVLLAVGIFAWRSRSLLVFMETGQIARNAEIAALYRAFDVWDLVIIVIILLALASFIYRYSRSRGIERQQLKWFVYSLSLVPVSMVLEELLAPVDSPIVQGVNWTINILSIAAFPAAMLVAITRYRLYDIDFIIRRTLLYSALTLTLALIYFGTVVVAQALFTRGMGEQPAAVLVVSTLLIAALFQPLRRRFQAAIDRRFYRQKYNAEQTLERFAARLQSEVNPEAIGEGLLRLVEENMQPDGAALWLVRR